MSDSRRKAKVMVDDGRLRADREQQLETRDLIIAQLQSHKTQLELQNQQLRVAVEQAKAELSGCGELFEHLPAGCLTLDPSGVVTHMNPSASRLLGIEPPQLLGRQIRDLLPESRRSDFDEWLKSVVSGLNMESLELDLACSNFPTFAVRIKAALSA